MNKTVIATAAVALVLAGAGGYWMGQKRPSAIPDTASGAASGQGSGVAAAPQNAPAVTVEAVKVANAALPQTITAVGSLRSDESITLRPEVAGRIMDIGFEEGRRVAKGTLLIRLDSAVNEAEVKQARANMTLAKSKYDRAVDLAKSNFISGQARDEAENNLKVADASLAVVEAKLAKTAIRAPFSGIIGLRQVSVGDYVKEGADLVNLESIDPLKVDFRVPETYLGQVQVGQSIEVALDAMAGKTYTGRVIAVNPLIDAAGRAIVVRAQVRNQDTTLRPGMFARVKLITRAERDALVVPEEALVPQGSERFVFKVRDGKVLRVKVETGQRRDGKVEIVSGVEKDDTIVTAGQIKLRDGAAVRVAGTDAAKRASGEKAVENPPASPPLPAATTSGLVTPASAAPGRAPKS